jgi:hypothetical protein
MAFKVQFVHDRRIKLTSRASRIDNHSAPLVHHEWYKHVPLAVRLKIVTFRTIELTWLCFIPLLPIREHKFGADRFLYYSRMQRPLTGFQQRIYDSLAGRLFMPSHRLGA